MALTALTDVKPMTCFKSMLPITSGPANPLNISDYPFLNTWGVIDPEVEFFADGVESDFDFEESTATRKYYILNLTKTENASDGASENETGKDMLYYCTHDKNSESQRNAVTITLTPNRDEKK